MRIGESCWLVVAVLVLGACGPNNKELGASEGSFKALTYNVAGLPQGISGSNPETNTLQMSPHFNAYDLVLLQEDFVYHEDLINDVTHPYQTETAQPKERLMHDGLNRLSRFDFSGFERHQWVACFGGPNDGAADCLAEKGFSVALTTFSTGVEVMVYNLHAEAASGEGDNKARAEGIDQLIEHVKDHAAGHAVLMGGDFNLHGFDSIDEPLLQKLMTEVNLIDACRFLECEEDIIDRIFFRSNDAVELTPTHWQIATEFVDEEGAPLSDHRAVQVNFDWERL